jgi:hypothetical protein
MGIGLALRDQVSRRVHCIFDVNNAPLTIQTLSIRPAIAGAATVVHVGNRKATRRPVLDGDIEPCRRRGRRPAVTDDDERRTSTGRACLLGMSRWIDERMRREAAARWKLDRVRIRNVRRIDLHS